MLEEYLQYQNKHSINNYYEVMTRSDYFQIFGGVFIFITIILLIILFFYYTYKGEN